MKSRDQYTYKHKHKHPEQAVSKWTPSMKNKDNIIKVSEIYYRMQGWSSMKKLINVVSNK